MGKKHDESPKVKVKVKLRSDAGKRGGQRIYVPYVKEEDGPSWIGIIILCAIQLWPIAALLGFKKLRCYWNKKKTADYRNYAAVIGDRVQVDVRELAAKLGKTPSLVMSDLQVMIDKGYMGSNAYLDKGKGVLILDTLETSFVDREIEVEPEEAAAEPVREVKVERPAYEVKVERPVREVRIERPVYETVREPEKVARPEGFGSLHSDEFEAKLREIRQLNDQIDDEPVSARIDRIGELTASIFRVVREKPDRADEVKKFMDYYLPTTFKLLKSYSLMEKQSYQGENIVASRRKIEDILDTLVTAFEQQQDRLFQTEALDVEADISVLETMMAKDGLVTPKGLDLRAMMSEKS